MKEAGRSLTWLARLSWLALALTGATYSSAVTNATSSTRTVAAVGLFAIWAVVLLALLVPSTMSLTSTRLLVPLAPVTAVVALSAGADTAVGLATVALGLVATVTVSTAEFGETFIQSSAYGHERRLPLRVPGVLIPFIVVLWILVAAATVAGPLLLADGSVWTGTVLCIPAIAGGWLITSRSHRLASRWLVVVPAGLVVHDRFVLAETLMVPRARVASLALAPTDTGAADLTGGALGPAIEVVLTDMETVVLAPDRKHPGGRALHVRSVLVSPSRPGRALRAWLASQR